MRLFSYHFDKNKGYEKYSILGIKFNYFNKKKRILQLQKEVEALRMVMSYSIDLTKLKSTQGVARKKQLESINIFKKIIEICSINKLDYFISFGTCIGAIRHKGFIPWDDDIDITMLRDDYLAILPFLYKVFDNTSYQVREFLDDHFQIRICRKDNSEVGVDIFPMDKYCKSHITDQEMSNLNSSVHLAIKKMKKLKGETDIIKVRNYISNLTNDLLDNMPQAENCPVLFYGIDYPHPHDMIVFNYDTIFPLKEIEFEGIKCMAPNNISRYLFPLYGDYNTLPSKPYYG